jgi:hypothetical protein
MDKLLIGYAIRYSLKENKIMIPFNKLCSTNKEIPIGVCYKKVIVMCITVIFVTIQK